MQSKTTSLRHKRMAAYFRPDEPCDSGDEHDRETRLSDKHVYTQVNEARVKTWTTVSHEVEWGTKH